MELSTAHFAEFFLAVHGYRPFRWQQELLDLIASSGRWPDRISAPTGSGKTSVIDVHAFANALAQQDGLRLPRRLVMTVNRRTLIDDHAEHADRLAGKLRQALGEGAPSVACRVAELLKARSGADSGLAGVHPLEVHTVRGGIQLDRDWNSAPLACAVICMTPDMWGSRILFRGYGTSRNMRPMEAGLLARDAVLVVDEAHLNRQLLYTARRVSLLDSTAEVDLGVPSLQVVETSATPATAATDVMQVHVDPGNLGAGEPGAVLERRLRTPKPLAVKLVDVARKAEAELAGMLAAECRSLAEDVRFQRAPIGCVVNTVSLANAVAAELKQTADDARQVLTVIGGQRPYDRAALTSLYPALAGGSDNNESERSVRFIVGTQALEVGIDIDLAALVTELAPAAAVVQRAGRVNRFGYSAEAQVIVIAPKYDDSDTRVPYEPDDLKEALAWLSERANTADGLAPLALYHDQPPAPTPRRALFQRLEWHDAERLARSSEETVFSDNPTTSEGEDLTLWLRDDFSERSEANAVVRNLLPTNAEHARRVADATPPLGAELFTTSLRRIRSLAREVLDEQDEGPLIAYRRGQAVLLGSTNELRPGDTLVVPVGTQVLSSGKPDPKDGPQDVHDIVVQQSVKPDELTQVRLLLPAAPVEGAPALLAAARGAALLLGETFAGVEEGDDAASVRLDAFSQLANYAQGAGRDVATNGAADKLRTMPADAEVTLVAGLGPLDEMFLIIRNRPLPTQEAASEFSRRNVALTDHSAAVAERARVFTQSLGLVNEVANAIVKAAELHDVGKAHPRFQAYLTSRWPQPQPVAKSKYLIPRQRRAELGLVGWRHEQLSAAFAWSELGSNDAELRELTAWLIGTSHGHGRGTFDNNAESLLLETEHGLGSHIDSAASTLFDNGVWESLFEKHVRRYGPWGLAFMEAVLRAADQTVSGEGR